MSAIKLNCPHCNQPLEKNEDVCGTTITCPFCSGEIIIPEKPSSAKVATITYATPSLPDADASTPDEELQLFELKPTAKAFLGQIIGGILLTPILIGIILLLNVWYKIASLQYRLTNQRLFVQRGLIAKQLEELELFRVKDVILKQTILQRILGFGTITVLSTDDTTPHITLIGMSNPVETKEAIRSAFRAARKREGVRMAEFIP